MTGCPVAFACAVACRFGELSQQRIRPQLVQRRRCTHQPPISRQSSQPGMSSGTSVNSIVSRWLQAGGTVLGRYLRALRLPPMPSAFDVRPLDDSALALEIRVLGAGEAAVVGQGRAGTVVS